jgi:hypothetical protein
LGKPDAARMQELCDLVQSSTNIDERTSALQELEELVSNLDNANDLEPLQLWKPLISFLSDSNSLIRFHTAWVLGTAVQNNEKSQQSFYKYGGVEAIIPLLNDSDVTVISKSLYCIAGLINHYPNALAKFIDLGGFLKLGSVLALGDLNCCRKILFMLSSLLTNESTAATHDAALNANLGVMVVSLLQSQDLDIVEKALVVLEVWENAYSGTTKDFFSSGFNEGNGNIKDDKDLYQRYLKLRSN